VLASALAGPCYDTPLTHPWGLVDVIPDIKRSYQAPTNAPAFTSELLMVF